MNTTTIEGARIGRPLTGRAVLLIFLGFFGTISAVNAYMIYSAISTFRGEEADHAYEVGLAYNREIAAARAQDGLGWKISAALSPLVDGRTNVSVEALSASGEPLRGVTVALTLVSPVDRARDRRVVLAPAGEGVYQGSLAANAGQWEAVIEAREPGGDRQFVSRNRVNLK